MLFKKSTKDNLPEGWRITVRSWGAVLGRDLCDALIHAPYPEIGWRTAGDLTSARKARQRAVAEIHMYLAKRSPDAIT